MKNDTFNIHTLTGFSGIGDLRPGIKQKIAENKSLFKRVLNESKRLSGLGYVQEGKVPFDEIVKQYNDGISEEEIKAWVWYKRKQGTPMYGWDKYYIEDEEAQTLVGENALFYHQGDLLPYPIYSYGNMYERLKVLRNDEKEIKEKFGKKIYENHLEVVINATPPMLSISNPDPKERPIIMAISDMVRKEEMFTIKTIRAEYLDTEDAEQLTKVNGKVSVKRNTKTQSVIRLSFDGENEYTLRDVFIKWLYTLPSTDYKKSSAIDIAEFYILGKAIRDDELKADQKAEIKANARNEGEELFARFLHEVLTPEDQKRLDELWNSIYNAQSDIQHKRVPVGFECSSRFKSGILQITPIQREGVAFSEAMGSCINAFDVGVGKTMTCIIGLATAMFSGRCQRPLVVVPKPTYKKWVKELIGFTDKRSGEFVPGILSYTDITVNEWGNLGTDYAGKIDFTKPVPAKSITLVTYEGFKRIGFSEQVSEDIFTELINILGQSNEKTARDTEIDYQKYREMMGRGQKNTIADIDVLGLDYIAVDEAHRCKNVFASVKADDEGNKRYNIQSAVSETGQKAFFLCNYIQKTFGRNIMLLTATPFTNSPLEIYSMLSLVAYESLKHSGIQNIKSFFDLFVLPTIEWTANYKDEIVEKEVIKSFTNRLVLQKLIYNHIIYKTGEEAGVKRPCKVNLPMLYVSDNGKQLRLPPGKQVLTYLKPTTRQEMNQTEIVNLAKQATTGKLNMADLFRALNYSLDNALSPFLYEKINPSDYKEFVDESPKIKFACECIGSVKKWHEQHNEPLSGQVIYANRGKQYFSLIKEYLEKEIGFKKAILFENTRFDEVEIISSEISEIKKENIKEAFLKGAVKVIIGTSTIREGIDLQENGTCLYNLYPDWNPTDIRQLEGRIWRQGNKFGYVRIVMPLVQDSMDVFVFQKLEEKTGRINDIWYKSGRGNVLDIESLDPQEVKLALITDLIRLTALYFDQEKQELQRDYTRIMAAIGQLDDVKEEISEYRNYRDKALNHISKFYNSFISSHYIKDAKEDKELAKRIKSFREELEKFTSKSTPIDEEILSIGRRIQNSVNTYLGDLYSWEVYHDIDYFKEHVTKVSKTERTILKPKRFTIDSDLSKVQQEYEREKDIIERKRDDYLGGQNGEESKRFKELMQVIAAKKEKLAVTGRTPEERSEEFAQLNYLLEFSSEDVPPNSCGIPSPESADHLKHSPIPVSPSGFSYLELEAEALTLELELLEL